METPDHRALKRLARSFLRAMGCCAVASEVSSPVPRHRVDVAGYGDGPAPSPGATSEGSASLVLRWSTASGPSRISAQTPHKETAPRFHPRTPFTAIIECKQSRADFLRDTRDRDALLRRRAALERQREHIETTLLPHAEPHLRLPAPAAAQPALFPELDTWDFARSQLPAYRETLREIARLDKQIYGDTKFCVLAAWRLADFLYIAAPRGMLRPHELPAGWGLIEFTRPSKITETTLDGSLSAVRVPCEPLRCADHRRVRLLRNIAVVATRRPREGVSARTRSA